MTTFEIDIAGNLVDSLDYFALTRPDHPAAEEIDRTISFAELRQRSNEVAANLVADGVQAGDFVGISLDDNLDHVVILCALAKMGGVIFSISSSEPPQAIQESLTELDIKAVIAVDPDFAGVSNLRLAKVLRAGDGGYEGPRIAGDAPVFLNRSSGTTGKAKAFLLSHRDNLHRAKRSGQAHGWRDDERYLCLSNLSFGLGRGSFFFLLQYGASYILTRSFDQPGLVDYVADKQVTILKLTPSFILPLLDYGAKQGMLFPGLRSLAVTSAPITTAQRLETRRVLASDFREQFGTNETGVLALSLPGGQDAKPGSVGRLLDEVEAKVVDEDGKALAPGRAGQIAFRLPAMLKSYWNDPTTTARAFRDGWFYPGDIAVIDEDRYVFFKGRADDVINNAGVKIYPVECEQLLQSYPPIIEAAAFPLPHKVAGEVVGACFVADGRVELPKLRDFCLARAAAYKLPFYIHQIDKMPRNAMGKIDKRRLRDSVIEKHKFSVQ
jgi:acyl-coenzyme A synthetase/AMP-(fatty) acid ligase